MGFCSVTPAQSKGLEKTLPRLNFPERGKEPRGTSTPVDLSLEGEENASGGLFQSVVSPSVTALLGQKNVLTTAPRAQEDAPRSCQCSEVKKRLGDRGEGQITETKRGAAWKEGSKEWAMEARRDGENRGKMRQNQRRVGKTVNNVRKCWWPQKRGEVTVTMVTLAERQDQRK